MELSNIFENCQCSNLRKIFPLHALLRVVERLFYNLANFSISAFFGWENFKFVCKLCGNFSNFSKFFRFNNRDLRDVCTRKTSVIECKLCNLALILSKCIGTTVLTSSLWNLCNLCSLWGRHLDSLHIWYQQNPVSQYGLMGLPFPGMAQYFP